MIQHYITNTGVIVIKCCLSFNLKFENIAIISPIATNLGQNLTGYDGFYSLDSSHEALEKFPIAVKLQHKFYCCATSRLKLLELQNIDIPHYCWYII